MSDFSYPIFIAAKAEAVWEALFNPEQTAAYWGHHNVSDWTAGSRWCHERSDGTGTADVEGEVVEIERPARLVITWEPVNRDDAPSRVAIDIVPLGPDSRICVTHSGLSEDAGERDGWPAVLSNMKTLLETGKTLSDDRWGEG